MIYAYTGTQVRAAEQPLLAAGRGDALMQQAAYGLATEVVSALRRRGQRIYGTTVAILVGKGNNGGDGLYAGAFLAGRGLRTTAVLTAGSAHPDALAAFRRAGGRVEELTAATLPRLAHATAAADVVIDSMLGTGARGGLSGLTADLVLAIGAAPAPGPGLVVACDVPTGVDAGTGTAVPPVVKADLTVTFGAAKIGLLANPGAGYAGAVVVVPIGLEPYLPIPPVQRVERHDLAALLPTPARDAHKYTRGVLGIVAGSAEFPGAAVLACRGALAAGVGMVRYFGPPTAAELVRQACPEVVCSDSSVSAAHVQAWVVGSGIGPADTEQLSRCTAAIASGLPVVVDAGALPVLPDTVASHILLTPHAGELAGLLSRISGATDRPAVEADTLLAARTAADLTRATVLLKGATTLVAAPRSVVFSQADGTPWLATAGSGDVLAGMIGGLFAQAGPDVGRYLVPGRTEAGPWAVLAALGASLHGLAGQAASAAAEGGPITAGQIAEALPHVWGKHSMLSN